MNDSAPIRYAGFWKRFGAYGYDVLIIQLLTLAPMFTFYHFPTLEQFLQLDPAVDAWFSAFTYFGLAISAVYNTLFIAGNWQATPGKRWCRAQVTMVDGRKLTILEAAIRHAVSGVSMVLAGLGYLTMFFRDDKAALHDMICNTRVIRL